MSINIMLTLVGTKTEIGLLMELVSNLHVLWSHCLKYQSAVFSFAKRTVAHYNVEKDKEKKYDKTQQTTVLAQ